jgi:hypothetical protein
VFVALKHRFLAVIATTLIGVLAVGLLRGNVSIEAAVLVVVVTVLDRYVMPFIMVGVNSLAAGAHPDRTATSGNRDASPSKSSTRD